MRPGGEAMIPALRYRTSNFFSLLIYSFAADSTLFKSVRSHCMKDIGALGTLAWMSLMADSALDWERARR